jgi:predicted ATPase
VQIPEALRSTVRRRLQSLDRYARAVIMRASVVGRDFDLHVVAATATRPPADVRSALERACSLQLLFESGCDRYSFRHALTRDIIYAELLETRVRPLHRRIARVLERAHDSQEIPLEELAYHSWAGGDARRALRYNELAGDNAAAVHAREDARQYYSRARSLTEIDSAAYYRLTQKLRAIGR